MKKLFKIFFIQIFIFSISNQLSADGYYLYNIQDFNAINSGCKQMRCSDLQYAPLYQDRFNNVNLRGSLLYGASFMGSELKKANLQYVRAKCASFRWADLENANLSHGDFSSGLFFGVNLKGVKAFKANFYKVFGLTNLDKAYLREQGAINVPEDLTDEEFELERLRVEKACRNRLWEWVDYLGTPIKYSLRKIESFSQIPLTIFIKGVEVMILPFLYPAKVINDLGMRVFRGKREEAE